MKIERRNLFTLNRLSEREKKNIEIFDLIIKKGSVSRTDVSRATGINMVSISNYVKEYIDRALVLEKGFDISSGGRKPELIEIDARNCIIGLDIRPCEIRGVFTDMLIVAGAKAKIPVKGSAERDIAEACVKLVEELLKKTRKTKEDVAAIGIGARAENLFPVAGAVEKALDKKVLIGTGDFCAAFGNKRLNPDEPGKAILYMHEDVGSGVFIDDEVFLGASSVVDDTVYSDEKTADKKSLPVSRNARYLAPWGEGLEVVRVAKREVARGIGTKIVDMAKGNIDNITIDVVVGAAGENDQVASDIIISTGINIGLRTAYLINLFHPGVVVIGGGIEKAGDLVLGPIRKMIKRLAFTRDSDTVMIVPSVLGEDAVALGAASLAAREIFLKA